MRFFAAFFVTATAFTATAAAAPAIEPVGENFLDLLRPVIDAALAGHWAVASALGVIFAVAMTRRYLSERVPFLKTEAGAAALVIVTGVATAVAAAGSFSWGVVWAGLGISVTAAGGWKLVKIAYDALRPLIAKLPLTVQKIIELVFFFVSKPGDAARAQAEKAGAEAVKAKPSAGIEGTAGKPEEF